MQMFGMETIPVAQLFPGDEDGAAHYICDVVVGCMRAMADAPIDAARDYIMEELLSWSVENGPYVHEAVLYGVSMVTAAVEAGEYVLPPIDHRIEPHKSEL